MTWFLDLCTVVGFLSLTTSASVILVLAWTWLTDRLRQRAAVSRVIELSRR